MLPPSFTSILLRVSRFRTSPHPAPSRCRRFIMGKQVQFDVVEVEKAAAAAPPWTPNKQEWTVMVTIAVVSLMVALDATVLVPVLPVGVSFSFPFRGVGAAPFPLPSFPFFGGPPVRGDGDAKLTSAARPRRRRHWRSNSTDRHRTPSGPARRTCWRAPCPSPSSRRCPTSSGGGRCCCCRSSASRRAHSSARLWRAPSPPSSPAAR